MVLFIYAGWFKDSNLPPGDQDHEWVACIGIEAATPEDAQAWGDRLAKAYCTRRHDQLFLWSEAKRADDPMYAHVTDNSTPIIKFGEEATDEFIGW